MADVEHKLTFNIGIDVLFPAAQFHTLRTFPLNGNFCKSFQDLNFCKFCNIAGEETVSFMIFPVRGKGMEKRDILYRRCSGWFNPLSLVDIWHQSSSRFVGTTKADGFALLCRESWIRNFWSKREKYNPFLRNAGNPSFLPSKSNKKSIFQFQEKVPFELTKVKCIGVWNGWNENTLSLPSFIFVFTE